MSRMGRNLGDAGRIRVGERMASSDLAWVLETLTADYTFDAEGLIVQSRDAVPLPRFVLGRAAEGSVWRFRSDVARSTRIARARLAGREPGAVFDGELPAAPERLAALERLLPPAAEPPASRSTQSRWRRRSVTRSGVVVGELWSLD
ncbi:MAG: hypothetical protein U0900_18650 [Myxococcota bacterium]